jgi:hypothetical protein
MGRTEGSGRPAARHTPHLVSCAGTSDPDLGIPSRSHFFPITGHARPGLLHVSDRSLSPVRERSQAPTENRRRRASLEEVRCVETVAERLGGHTALSELLAAPSESLPIPFGAGMVVTDFSACYARELSSLVWFVISLGADAHRAGPAGAAVGGQRGRTARRGPPGAGGARRPATETASSGTRRPQRLVAHPLLDHIAIGKQKQVMPDPAQPRVMPEP